ncbi:multiubiquitin domain-containing protein [Mesorhizobium sp. B2-2-4]|nr:multiubiquitin domain-containing protein [Mesorhizobium sp. B2-2-4]
MRKRGPPFITGLQLKRLAGVDPQSYGVWLAQQVGDDRLIGNTEKVDLQGNGTERFFTGVDTTTEGAGGRALKAPPGTCRDRPTSRLSGSRL